MDTFFEQIVVIRKSAKEVLAFCGIWFLALGLTVVLLLFEIPFVSVLSPLLICAILYGAYKLSTFLNVEYEYIITNGIMDVDKITNKSSRKRMMSFDLSKVTRLEKYTPNLMARLDKKRVNFTCNENDSEMYFLETASSDGKAVYLIFAPNDKIKSAIEKFVPKFIANSAFR